MLIANGMAIPAEGQGRQAQLQQVHAWLIALVNQVRVVLPQRQLVADALRQLKQVVTGAVQQNWCSYLGQEV